MCAKSKKMRGLSPNFLADFVNSASRLKGLLENIHSDHTLDIEIRENYINIYYRGGNILKITQVYQQDYNFYFDLKYLSSASSQKRIFLVDSLKIFNPDWEEYFPFAKKAMDKYYANKKNEEKEFQQLVVRTNNYSSIAKGTDYFIIDIEYAFAKSRFDFIAVEWQSESSIRKLQKGYLPKLMIIEMKYGEKAIKGTAGLHKHHQDIVNFISNQSTLINFKIEMLELLKQKRLLGLIPCLDKSENKNEVTKFSDAINIGYLLSDHDPASKQLVNELKLLPSSEVRFLTANFTGYALYKENVFDLQSFNKRFLSQIG